MVKPITALAVQRPKNQIGGAIGFVATSLKLLSSVFFGLCVMSDLVLMGKGSRLIDLIIKAGLTLQYKLLDTLCNN